MSTLADKCKKMLLDESLDIFSEIDFDVNGKMYTLSFEYIIDTFMQASEESQLIFLAALEKSMNTNNMEVEKFFEGMGELFLRTHLSKNIKPLA